MEPMETNQDFAAETIKRFAIDPSGRLGSLYDGYRDCVLGQLNVRSMPQSYQSVNSVKCQVVKGNTSEKLNLLQLVGIEEELQLSMLLNLTSKMGLASLMDYSRPMNQFTRILHFEYVYSEEQLLENMCEIQQSCQSSVFPTSATRIVSGVSWGFYIVVILQLPSGEETMQKLDAILEKLPMTLENESDAWTLNTDDEDLLATISDITVHSNVPELTRMTSLCEVCRHINQLKRSISNYPITYTLRPITCVQSESTTSASLPPIIVNSILNHLWQMVYKIRNIEILLNNTLPKSLGGCSQGLLYNAYQQWLSINKDYKNEIDRLSKLLVACRNHQFEATRLERVLGDINHTTLTRNIDQFTEDLNALEEKGLSIMGLYPFRYCNVLERGIDENDTDVSIERKLIIDEQRDRVLCTNDDINKNNPEHLQEQRSKLVDECSRNPSLRLIYADFSYTSYPLNAIMVLPSSKVDGDQNQPKPKDLPLSIAAEVSTEIINILLLGETGVGKSTFINALVNYLTFDSLQTAESTKPVILIPVSFLMTTGDNFDECTVQLDSTYKADDEHFNAFGQSVTQHCQSYIIHLKNRHGQKLRIIDTPGFGDTRGPAQDDCNMQYILEYINSLTHLNAICFLFKPNIAQVNIFFRSCITQLLDHLGPNSRQNIIFCFTNTRSTFYTPGDTASSLKSMLSSMPSNHVLLLKENTFCFDSESFRYLAALRNKVRFDDWNRSEYEQSWVMSSKESNRLIDHISQNLSSYQMNSERQAMKSAQFEIIHTIRPILEVIGNILRNILLCMLDSPNHSIELRAITLHRLATRCRSCRPMPIQVGSFWIIPDMGHEMQDKCLTCSCALEHHMPIEYMLEYHSSTEKSDFDALNRMLLSIFAASVEFAHFLVDVTHSTNDDPFLIGFQRMIEEEKNICNTVQPNEMNMQLVQQLESVLGDYEKRMHELRSQPCNEDLSAINDRIKMMVEHPILRAQIEALKKHGEILMNPCEHVC